MSDITAAMRRAHATLTAIDQRAPDGWVSAGQFARAHWPDSPAWQRRTNRRDGRSGAVGGTMPMVGARLLNRLVDAGLARTRWTAHHQTLYRANRDAL